MNKMNRFYTMTCLIASSVTLISCGGNEQSVNFPGRGAEVFYTYPDVDQRGVSIHTPIVVRLSDPLSDPDSLDDSMIRLLQDGNPVAANIAVAEGSDDRSIVIRPAEPLQPGTTYQVELVSLTSTEGPVAFSQGSFSFTTALAVKGPQSTQISDAQFAVTRMFPDGNDLPILDFSSLRFQFSQPIDPASVEYGNSIVIRDGDDQVVPANILVRNQFLTIDPVDNLQPGVSYSVSLSGQLDSLYGASLQEPFSGSYRFDFVPQASGPTETLALQAPASGALSVLTGQPVNLVPVIATLLGDSTQSQQQGDVFAELAFIPNYPTTTPLRIAKGGMLSGDALDVRVSGVVPAGFDSGDVKVQFISDATGYLLPNPYTDAPDAPRQIRMMMDVAISTGNAVANAGFTQDVLHLELVGQAIVEDGRLTSDALTVVESEVLGLETAFGVLSFRMEAYADQIAAPRPAEDSEAPQILSWSPDIHALKHRKGEPITVNFTEPVDPVSLQDRVLVFADGVQASDVSYRLDGTSLIINTAIDFGVAYQVSLLDGITDLAGNPLAATTLSFDMPVFADVSPASPFVLTGYPGVPCPVAAGSRDLVAGIAGRCAGGDATDDRFALASMPADRSIKIRFSQNMDRNSIIPGQSFRVEQIDASGAVIEPVSGRLVVRDRDLEFTPDQPWLEDAFYQYVLVSNNASNSSACTPGMMVCAASGLPLKTRLLSATAANAPAINGGGPDMIVAFRGAIATRDSVYTQLSNLPVADVNANTLRDAAEDNALNNPELLKNSTVMLVDSTGGSVSAANIGCPIGESCPEQSYAYLIGSLDGEVAGYIDAADIPSVARATVPDAVMEAGGGVLIYLYPNIMMLSDSTVYSQTSIPLTSADPAPTGPLIMRMRPQCDARSNAAAPAAPNATPRPQCTDGHHGLVEGWIIAGEQGPEFLSTLDLYLDAPALQPVVRVIGVPSNADHNLRSYGLADVSVRGPVRFLEDGRMEISQLNQADIFANIEISAVAGLAGGNVLLRIPEGSINLNYISVPVKR